MPDVPAPVTSPPTVPGQPYDATVSGPSDSSQSASQHVYDATGGQGAGDPWPKVQDGGAADWQTGKITGTWPTDGSSSGGAWKQC